MHSDAAHLDINHLIHVGPFKPSSAISFFSKLFMLLGGIALLSAFLYRPTAEAWACYYVGLLFFMGLACGGVAISAIFQIVRAKWAAPIRRLAEANVAFLPFAYLLFLLTWVGKESLFPWARGPMPGREMWMQPGFVYARFAVLFAILFFMMHRFVALSTRSDAGLARERAPQDARYKGWIFQRLTEGWLGSGKEILPNQVKASYRAPVLIICYSLIYSLFAFEMVMAMDKVWYSNMFGGFLVVGNLYMAWSALAMWQIISINRSPEFAALVKKQQLWDNGKLMFGFCMLWGYLFFSQFLPQWYGNLPEETGWMILRTREAPWKQLSWVVFSCCFVIPFIVLLSEDVKQTPKALFTIAAVIWLGMFLEKYVIVMPQITGSVIPFSWQEVGIWFGFLGVYLWSVNNFLTRHPMVNFSSPLCQDSTAW